MWKKLMLFALALMCAVPLSGELAEAAAAKKKVLLVASSTDTLVLKDGKKDPTGNNEIAVAEQEVSHDTAEETADTNADETTADAALLMKLLQKPEMAALLKTLAASL